MTQYDVDLKSLITAENCVIGFDNYHHAYGSSVNNKVRNTQLVLANFTVFGISLCKEEVDTSFVYDDFKDPLPSVPPAKESLLKYVDPIMDKIRTDLCDMNDTSGRDYCYWNVSRVVRDDLRAVPIRAYNNIDAKAENDRGRENYKPCFVSGRNSASNIGVAHILSHVFNAIKDIHYQSRYSFVKMDVNLYVKFLQVLFHFQLLICCRCVGQLNAFSTTIDCSFVQYSNTGILSSMLVKVYGRMIDFSNHLLHHLSIISVPIPKFFGLVNYNK